MPLRFAWSIILVNMFANFGDVQSKARTLHFGPPPKPVPVEHWMQAAVRGIHKGCPGVFICSKDEPLGMEDGRIPDDSITASSYWNNLANHAPVKARLNTQIVCAAWCRHGNDHNPWIQVDFNTTVYVTGIVTQGRGLDGSGAIQYVTEYQVAYSEDGQSWHNLATTNGMFITFPGNTDSTTQVTNKFKKALRTRIIRIVSTAWREAACMRFELIGCYA